MTEQQTAKNRVKIMDLTFRDGHQSLFATRMRTEDMIPIAEQMDQVGFFAIEVWGGATFDTMHRFLNEDPWERPKTLKRYIKKTPLSMLLRGQNLVGYRNYADDVVKAFVDAACKAGIDMFRVFDALNDFRNFDTSVKAIKANGKHFQGAISYSLTERKMGGEVFNIDYYLNKARILQDMGADSICIKDMAGLLAPYDAFELVKALKEALTVPLHLHSHYTSGMASMTCLKAIEAGIDIIDCCLAPFALRTSHPAVEPIVVALQGTPRDTGLDLKRLFKLGQYLEEIAPKYRHLLDDTKLAVVDTGVLIHQVPGGMLSNLVNQLRQMDALDRINEVFEQLPRVRKELGYPPLVTPTSQIVGTQTMNNVLFDSKNERYKMITDQTKDYCYGLYGKPPKPIDSELQKKALKGYPRGEEPISVRPADILEPELEEARAKARGLARTPEDEILVALYPVTGKRFLNWKYGKETPPSDVKPISLEEAKKREALVAKAKAGLVIEKPDKVVPPKGPNLQTFNVYVGDQYYRVEVEQVGGPPVFQAVAPAAQISRPSVEMEDRPTPEEMEDTPLIAPMPGMIIRYEVDVGDKVKAHDTIVIMEAMKMENALTSEVNGTVKGIFFKEGDAVRRGDVLAIIG
ncbi:MAG: pyruvate carboxylase subunit B [Deltaproteobacteria bacterium]|nr:pyruvate carboxylase subunit B [Deltaproteobacteria bacterium]MBW2020781.1 pyruvate carboxylase subunit B [Deltaproteobacteria bacterium]MBW2075383.1 pyruvate carboxylase subunit B [Deltaproteobacteria bacterium]